jgi:16S rRNA (uracil1498-N3)-methyltransferase
MRNIRLYYPHPLPEGRDALLEGDAFHHAFRVLRCRQGDALILFDGQGTEIEATVVSVSRREACLRLGRRYRPRRESPLVVELYQGVSKGDRMDWALQKATELGVHRIVPVYTDNCAVRQSAEQAEKKWQHWQKVVIAACEQSGRVCVPEIVKPGQLSDLWLPDANGLSLFLDPLGSVTPEQLRENGRPETVRLVIGPEGGLSASERAWLDTAGAIGLRLGPRVLRTETAAACALTLCQMLWGDFND